MIDQQILYYKKEDQPLIKRFIFYPIQLLHQLINNQTMHIVLLLYIMFIFIAQIASQSTNPTSNLYFENVRIGRVTFPNIKAQQPQTRFTIATYSRPLPQSPRIVCQVALSSFNIPSNSIIKNKIQLSSASGCTQTFLNLTSIFSFKNHNVVNYIVIDAIAFDSRNFLMLSLEVSSTEFNKEKTIKATYQMQSFNISGQTKYHSFLQGLYLYSVDGNNAEGNLFQYGFSISIADINSYLLQYQIHSIGNRTYRGSIAFLVIVYNNQLFNKQQNVHFLGETKKYSNFTNKIIINPVVIQMQNSLVFVGLSSVAMKGNLVFSFEVGSNGDIYIGSTGEDSVVNINYLIFPKYTMTDQSTNNSQYRVGQDSNLPSESSSNLTIIIIITAASIFATVIIIVVCCCCCKTPQVQLQTKPADIIAQQPHNIRRSSSIQGTNKLGQSSIEGNNILRQSQLMLYQLKMEICSVCQTNKTQMMTHCQHYFHVKCLKQSFSRSQNCPDCSKVLMNRKITVFCRNCSIGYVFKLQQSMILDDELGVDLLCQRCRQGQTGNGQVRSEKSDQVWLQYAIQTNQHLFVD